MSMRASFLFACLAALGILAVSPGGSFVAFAQSSSYDDIPMTRWLDRDGTRPITYEEFMDKMGDRGPLQYSRLYDLTTPGRDLPLVAVMVDSALYEQVWSSVDLLTSDIVATGDYDVTLITMRGGTHQELKSLFVSMRTDSLIGCILIGDLPIPWFEHGGEQFPVDLYYMDLDGEWTDADLDGRYDGHDGHKRPEIWVSRMTPSPLIYGGQTEAELLENYLAKNHAYRTGALQVSEDRALVYVDDDWEPWAEEWADAVNEAWGEVVLVKEPSQTSGTDYLDRLSNEAYEHILVCVHSSPQAHYFYPGTVEFFKVVNADPECLLYNLFACSNCRYVENNYMGGWYTFCDTYGVCAVGSTKTGSMLDFIFFYDKMAHDRSVGWCFRRWFRWIGISDIAWFYGMTLLGDGTLHFSGVSGIAEGDTDAALRRLLDLSVSPNPSSGRASIAFSLPESGHTTVDIYSVEGKRVRTLSSSTLPAGGHILTWDGKDGDGHAVSPGLYFCRVDGVDCSDVAKVLVVR